MFNRKNKNNHTRHLEKAIKKSSGDRISIKDIMIAMNAGGFGLVMLFFSLPIILPFPPPLPSIIAIPLAVFSIQMMIGLKSPKLPKIISKRTMERTVLASIIEKSSLLFRKIEKILKPRFLFLTSGIGERIIGFFTLSFSLSVLIPLPLTNFLPGIGILITSLGLISRDGIMIVLGVSIGIFGLTTTFVTLVLGVELIGIIKDMILGVEYRW